MRVSESKEPLDEVLRFAWENQQLTRILLWLRISCALKAVAILALLGFFAYVAAH